MSYIWENIDIKRPFFINPQSMGGATEAQISLSAETPVYVNPFLRFSDVFSDNLFSEAHSDDETINCVTHYLAISERLHGDTLTNAHLYCIEEDILDGLYGESVRTDYLSLTNQHQKMIVQFIFDYHKRGELTELFDEVFMSFFGRLHQTISGDEHFDDKYTRHSAEIIYSKARNIYYFYCGTPESDYYSALFRLIKNLFADCTRSIIPIWGKYDLGIVGNDDLTQSTVPIVGQTQLL